LEEEFHMSAWKTLVDDFRAVKERDPAIPDGIRGFFEIALCTPGFQAVAAHRLIHFLHLRLRIPVLPRFLGLIVRWWTGTEIHPGAKIGKGVFIDHASGVVIGESAVVGDGVTLYQGVTLGATGNEKTWKRHPTLESGVFVGSGARILGPVTVGRNVRVGAGSVVVKDVPPDVTVVGVPAEIIKVGRVRVSTEKERLEERIDALSWTVLHLEEELWKLRKQVENVKGVESLSYATEREYMI
jgi:serine O-acetyltransferase